MEPLISDLHLHLMTIQRDIDTFEVLTKEEVSNDRSIKHAVSALSSIERSLNKMFIMINDHFIKEFENGLPRKSGLALDREYPKT